MKKLFLLASISILSLIFVNCKSTSTDSNTRYRVSLTAVPSEGGSVSPTNGQHDEGTSLDISATPNQEWVFVRWEGDHSGTNRTATITVSGDKNIEAIFEKKTYALTVNITGEGAVDEQIVQNKITDYESGTVVELTANPAEGWKFVEWQGGLTGTANPQLITIDEAKEVTAVFEMTGFSLTVNVNGEGTVAKNPDQSAYESGTMVELTANPAEGWEFIEWQGALTGTANPQQITMDEPKDVTAVFEKKSFALTVNINGEGTVTKNPDQSDYEFGTVVELTANPAEGWEFVEWQGALTGTANPQEITIDGPKDVTAVFTEQTISSLFYLDTNGVTVKCEDANVGDTGEVSGVMYTKRIASEITPANAETTCTSEITSMIGMFDGESSFNGDISSWDVSSVTDMNLMFYEATSFNGDLSSWDVGSVTNMQFLFFSAYSFNGDISSWNVSSVTEMGSMFGDATSFNGDISSWDVSNVMSMGLMFSDAESFNGDLSSWDVSSVTRMYRMFDGALSFSGGDLSGWNVSSVTSMSYMFWNATSFNGDISNWNVSSVKYMDGMFTSARSFNGDLSGWDVSSVTEMGGMLAGTSFNGDISSWDVSNVTNMGTMLAGTPFNGDISRWDVSSVKDMGYMFWNASSFNGDLSSWDVSSVTSMTGMFLNATTFNQDLSGWCVTNIASEPVDFSTGSPLQESYKPVWGTCPGS